MDSKICKVCGNSYVRRVCDYCARSERWNQTWKTDEKYFLGFFTPRILRELKRHTIPIAKDHLSGVAQGNSFLISGAVGSGKTLYACKLMLKSMEYCFTHRTSPRTHTFVSSSDLFDRIRKGINSNESADILHKFKETDFLVIDDLGMEVITDWVHEKLYQIINHRYEYLKTTIITTNLTGKQLSEKIGDRIPSRLVESYILIKLKERDYRIEKI